MIDASREEGTPVGISEEEQVKADEGEVEGDGAGQPIVVPAKKSNKERKLTDKEIVAHAVTFILAGYETTANTLAYTSYLLALNPDIQEKLQSEIDGYFDDKPVS